MWIFHRPEKRFSCLSSLWVISFILLAITQSAYGQAVKILPLGDTGTTGLDSHVSYRYDLWFDLIEAGFNVDFVGDKSDTAGEPDLELYPEYLTTFDRDYEGQDAARTDQLLQKAKGAAATYQPDIVLLLAGSYDIVEMGSAGVSNANFGIRDIIEGIRTFVPGVTILVSQTIPYEGPGSDFVESLNEVIATVASEMNTTGSPIILVDQYTGYDISSMTHRVQQDHPNRVGEAWVAQNWFEVLADILPAFETFQINAAISDAWFYPVTSGQGFFIIVWEDSKTIFLAWFTYETERPPDDISAILGEPGHRWIIGLGPYDGDTAVLDVFLSSGMIFDSGTPPVDTTQYPDATMEIVWTSCKAGVVKYNIPSLNLMGEVPIERIVQDKVAACEAAQPQ